MDDRLAPSKRHAFQSGGRTVYEWDQVNGSMPNCKVLSHCIETCAFRTHFCGNPCQERKS
eukprot:790447-Pelagomonas_calceolata.AAC.1